MVDVFVAVRRGLFLPIQVHEEVPRGLPKVPQDEEAVGGVDNGAVAAEGILLLAPWTEQLPPDGHAPAEESKGLMGASELLVAEDHFQQGVGNVRVGARGRVSEVPPRLQALGVVFQRLGGASQGVVASGDAAEEGTVCAKKERILLLKNLFKIF